MAQKAIRTTLPDGRIALNNIIDKYTGESIQLVKVDSLPSGVSADGIIYFETSNSEYGTEYYRRAIITGQINVQWFGAVCGYRTASDYVDSTEGIQRAIAFMKSIVADQADAESRRNTYTLLFPASDEGRGYAVMSDLDFGGGYNVIMDAPIYRLGGLPTNGAFITVGRGSATERLSNRHKKHKLWVRREQVNWIGEEYVGILVKNHVRSKIEIIESRGFEVGVRFMGDNSAFAYNSEIFVNEIINSRIGLDFYSVGEGSSGYTTSNIIKIGRIGQDSSTNNESYSFDRVGIRLNSASYICESLTFNGGVIEGLSPAGLGVEGVPVHIIYGQRNRFYNFRHEGNSTEFLKVEDHTQNYGNSVELTYAPSGDPRRLIEQGRPDNWVETRREELRYSTIGRGRTLYSSGDIADRFRLSDGLSGAYIEGFDRRVTDGSYTYYVQNATIVDGYLNLAGPNNNIGFIIDTKHAKSFIVNINQDPSAVCTIHYECMDKDGEIIPRSATPTRGPNNISEILDEGFKNFTPFYSTLSDYYFSVSEDVHSVRILFYSTQQGGTGLYVARIKAISLISIDGRFEAPVRVQARLLQTGDSASRPTRSWTGYQYFDTTLGQPIWRSGSNWVDATGTVV